MSFIETLTKKINIPVRNTELFEQAFTHKSLSKGKEPAFNNERLEYLGDAVLGLVSAHLLYRLFPDDDEGSLSRKRASLVNEATLSQISDHFGLSEFLRAHHSQSLEDLRANPRITSSLFEALVGAFYLDSGFETTQSWLETVFVDFVKVSFDEHDYSHDYKTRFQELIQSKYKVTPFYETIESTGPDHLKHFTVTVSVEGRVFGQGVGTSKKMAAQEAAKKALEIEEKNG